MLSKILAILYLWFTIQSKAQNSKIILNWKEHNGLISNSKRKEQHTKLGLHSPRLYENLFLTNFRNNKLIWTVTGKDTFSKYPQFHGRKNWSRKLTQKHVCSLKHRTKGTYCFLKFKSVLAFTYVYRCWYRLGICEGETTILLPSTLGTISSTCSQTSPLRRKEI